MRKLKRWILNKLIKEYEIRDINSEYFFKKAYEHGLKKAGYKDETIPCWDNKVYENLKKYLSITIK